MVTVGLVGPEADRQAARERITHLCQQFALPEPAHWAEADEGWEQLTLQAIHRDVHRVPGEYAVLYMHTKGAARDLDSQVAWRRSMTRALVGQWGECAARLEDGHDVVGCHWTRSLDWPEQGPFFAGNFWLARASYLRRLPPPENKNRWQAETWVTLGARKGHEDLPLPRTHDMLPGYPVYG